MRNKVYRIIPRHLRPEGLWVCVTILLRSILNFLSIGALVPLLLLILEPQSLAQNAVAQRCAAVLGIDPVADLMWVVLAAVLAFVVAKSLLTLLFSRYERNYIYKLYKNLSTRLLVAYHNRGLGFIKHSNSNILSRDVNVTTMFFVSGVLKPYASIVGELLLLVLVLVAFLVYMPLATLLVMAIFVPAIGLYYFIVRRRIDAYGMAENAAQREKMRIVAEVFRGYTDVEVCDAFEQMKGRFNDKVDEIVNMQKKNSIMQLLPQTLTELCVVIGMIALVVFGAMNNGGGGDTKILFGLFCVAAIRVLPSVRSIMSGWSAIKYNRYTIDIIADAIGESSVDASRGEAAVRKMPFERQIEVRNVDFAFDDGDGRKVLDNFSLTITRGEKVGIKGESGSGKSTLFNLLLGFYAPSRGGVYVDDSLLTESTRRSWLQNVGYVSQNVFICDGSFADNIALGVAPQSVDPERLRRVVQMSRLDELVTSLPRGVDSHIGEAGCRLSGGQRQRVAIARALYKGAEVLLFDEATSALDSATESEINAQIEHLYAGNKNLTIIIIAHRQSSLEFCDRVITI